MRPINRGELPKKMNNTDFIPSKYQEYRGHLVERIGPYCSYCERPISHSIAVEHIRPKKEHPNLAVIWSNLLLACTNCNSIKNDIDVVLQDYFWPDVDNTARAFLYGSAGTIRPNSSLPVHLVEKALNSIALTGLDREPSEDLTKNPEMTDKRWAERRSAWEIANHAKRRLRACDVPAMREQIIDTATAKGFFSIWMTVFDEDLQMKKDLIAAFKGTAEDCYDNTFTAIARKNGLI